MKTDLSTRQKEVLQVILTNMEDKRIDLDTIMAHVSDRQPFVQRRKTNNNNGHYRDQRKNGVIQAIRQMGYKLNISGVRFERFSKLGRGNKAIYGFKDQASVQLARKALMEQNDE